MFGTPMQPDLSIKNFLSRLNGLYNVVLGYSLNSLMQNNLKSVKDKLS
jgi:hypothetical protein